jgi:hypothetical protein
MRRRIARPPAPAGLFARGLVEPGAPGNLTGARIPTCYGGRVASPEPATIAGLTSVLRVSGEVLAAGAVFTRCVLARRMRSEVE